MATQRLTDNEVSLVLPDRVPYAELGADWRNWCPVKTIPDAEVIKGYVNTRVGPPATSKYGDLSVGVATSSNEVSANLVWARYKVEFGRTEVAEARRNGYDGLQDTVVNATRQMNRFIAKLIFKGLDDNVAINGLFDSGEDGDNSLDETYWDTPPNPLTHLRAGVKDMIANGFAPPYVMFMDYGLYPGWFDFHDTSSDMSHDAVARRDYLSNVYFYEGGTDSGTKIYPLPGPTTDDGVWMLVKPDINNFMIAETQPPSLKMNQGLDLDTNSYRGYIEWRGTLLIKRAGSIVYEPDVDLAS